MYLGEQDAAKKTIANEMNKIFESFIQYSHVSMFNTGGGVVKKKYTSFLEKAQIPFLDSRFLSKVYSH